MYKGICKYNSSRFWDETSNMAKFTKLMETSFNDRLDMLVHKHIGLKNYTEVFCTLSRRNGI